MCSTVACMSHLARLLDLQLAAQRQTWTRPVQLTSAPKKYSTPAKPMMAAGRADGNKRRGIENDLAERARAVLVHHWQHKNPRRGRSSRVHPGDGVEMRELPEKRMAKSSHAGVSSLPVAAVQPIIGGIAPGNAPMNVAQTVRVFSGVYASK